jgi:hypothetical protein
LLSIHNPLWKSFFFGASLHINDHHMDDKLQAYDLFEIMVELGFEKEELHMI